MPRFNTETLYRSRFPLGTRATCARVAGTMRAWSFLAALAFACQACTATNGSQDPEEVSADAGLPAADATPPPTSSEVFPCHPCDPGERYDYVGPGHYEVPLAPEQDALSIAAVTPVRETRLRVSEGVVVLEYDLPPELTGVVQQVQLSGPAPLAAEPIALTGPAGSASCYVYDVGATTMSLYCTEELPGVTIDRDALRTLLQARGLPEERIQEHLAVTDVFIEDPIGILYATLGEGDDS